MAQNTSPPQLVIEVVDKWLDLSNADKILMQLAKADNSSNAVRAQVLYHGQQMVEKLLKAIYIAAHNRHAPPTHNLVMLARNISQSLSEQDESVLANITSFNVKGRYDDTVYAFISQCTLDYVSLWADTISTVYASFYSQAIDLRSHIQPDTTMIIK